MNFAPYLSLPPWRAVSINNTWELGESIRGYPCGEESDGGWALELLGRGECEGRAGKTERSRRALRPCPSYLLKGFFRVEVSGVAPAMHHRRAEEVRGRESAVVRGTSGHGCN